MVDSKLKLVEEVRVQESVYVNERLKSLSWKIDQQEQYSRVNNLRLYNCPKVENEDTTDVALEVFKQMGVTIPKERVDISHRVKGGTSNQDPDAIIIKFVRRDDKIRETLKTVQHIREFTSRRT